MRKFFVVSFSILFFTLFNLTEAAQTETIPVGDEIYSWVYDYIDQLSLRGYFEDLHSATKPYFRGEIAQSLLNLKKRIGKNEIEPSQSELWIIQRLEEEFGSEIETISAKEQSLRNFDEGKRLKWGIDFFENMQFQSNRKSCFFESGLPYLGVEIKDDFSLFVRYNVDEGLTHDPFYTGKVWRGVAGEVAQAYLGFKLPWFNLVLGREKLSWGQSKIGSLILSEQILPLDLIQIQAEWRSFKGTFFAAFLDPLYLENSLGKSNINRYLSGHRLSLKIGKAVELGFSETVVYGGENRGLEPYYLNPLIWYHGAQLNQNKDDNTFISFDFNLRPQKDLIFYGEFLIDDYQIENNSSSDKEPNELGFVAGFSIADFLGLEGCQMNMEYERVNNHTYNQKFLQNRYLYKNRLLGSRWGPDSDCFLVWLKGWIRKGLELKAGYSITRKGEGDIFTLWDKPWLGVDGDYKEKFPTGVVEKVREMQTSLEYFHNHALRIKLCAAYTIISNRDNDQGTDEEELGIDLLIQYHFLRR